MSPREAVASRVRDPERGAKILNAAAELFAERGYHSVSMAEVGQAAGIVGSGIYRHFDSKYAVLVALLEDVMTRLLANADEIVDDHADSSTTLDRLVQTQIDFCLDSSLHVLLYRRELHSLKADDGRRLRRMQRRYNEEWVSTLLELRPELDDAAARSLVYAAIGAIQSVVTYRSGRTRDEESTWLAAVARNCLAT